MEPGTKVTYIPFENADRKIWQHGMVKRLSENGVFVVFHCNDDWVRYFNYTAQLCNYDNLKLEWL